MTSKACTSCGKLLAITRENFGSTPSGGFRGKCRKCMVAHTQSYDRNNPEKRRQRSEVRDDRGGHVSIDPVLKQRLLAKQRRLCLCCGERIEVWQAVQLDHLTPVARGGTHDERNLAIAHDKCNAEKHAKTLEEHWLWRLRVGLPVVRFTQQPDGSWRRA